MLLAIIDKTGSMEIDAHQIFESFYGTSQVTMEFNDKAEFTNQSFSHAKDSIYDKNENAFLLSAIMLIKREYEEENMKINVTGEIFLAPTATHPLSREIINNIKQSFDGCHVCH